MVYQVQVTSRAQREEIIKKRKEASNKNETFYDFRGGKAPLPIIQIDLSLPIYRMENCRTFIGQHEYLAREKGSPTFFVHGQENETAQQIQHEILANLARQGRANSVVPIIDVLREEQQTERILITSSGIVVNGNRRLAAMRELFDEDSTQYSRFNYVDCIVLPEDTSPAELIEIEAALQGKPETKLDYDWVGDCQLIKRLQSIGKKPADIAARLHRKLPEIKNSLAALVEADLYLKEWVKTPDEYSRVKDGEQFFKDIPAQLKDKSPSLTEASRLIAWHLYDSKDQLGERLYNFNVAIGKRASDVLDRLAEDLNIDIVDGLNDENEQFSLDIEEDTSTNGYAPLISTLKASTPDSEAVRALIEACRGAIESERGQKSGTAALKAISAAHAKLAEVDLSKADSGTLPAIEKQLDAIIKRSSDLKTKVNIVKEGREKSPDQG